MIRNLNILIVYILNILFVFLMIPSCAFPGAARSPARKQISFNEIINSWTGRHISELIEAWGEETSIRPGPDLYNSYNWDWDFFGTDIDNDLSLCNKTEESLLTDNIKGCEININCYARFLVQNDGTITSSTENTFNSPPNTPFYDCDYLFRKIGYPKSYSPTLGEQ
jgi:hypothetical protein